MVFCFVPGVLTNPLSSYFYSKERSKELNIISIVQPLLYWAVIFIAYSFIGISSFAISKVVAPTVAAIAYWVIYKRLFIQKGQQVVKITDALIHILIPSVVCVACCFFAKQFMFFEKSTAGLIMNVVVMIICIIPTMVACIAVNKELRATVVDYMSVVFKKKQ
jgi:peptidoglycan biosynthesis protein MviN/MurJ (putative lipid II flippase)